jgi:hypothetical protein
MFKTVRAIRFLFLGPFLLVMLFVINLMTSPGHWWVQWAALGIGIAWFACLLRVIRTAILLGGVAALGAWWMKSRGGSGGGPIA